MKVLIGGICPGIILDCVADAIGRLGIPDKSNGYLAILNSFDGRLLLHAEIGYCLPDKFAKYCEFSLEKAMRLYEKGERSSWMSRDPDNNKYGGGIRAGVFLLGFSGLPELADEAIVIDLAEKMGWISRDEAMTIAFMSNNTYINKLL